MKKVMHYNDLPDVVPIPKFQVEPEISVVMSRGLPEAYLKMVEYDDYLDLPQNHKNYGKGGYTYSVCQPGSRMAEKAPPYLVRWAKILNELIAENIDRFIDEDYLETEGDRAVVRQVAAGIPFDELK